MKKTIGLMVAMVMLMGCMLNSVALAEGSGLDIVFVIDDTRSMKQNDPQRLSADALRQFVGAQRNGCHHRESRYCQPDFYFEV